MRVLRSGTLCDYAIDPLNSWTRISNIAIDIQLGVWLWEGRTLDELRIGCVLTVIIGCIEEQLENQSIKQSLRFDSAISLPRVTLSYAFCVGYSVGNS